MGRASAPSPPLPFRAAPTTSSDERRFALSFSHEGRLPFVTVDDLMRAPPVQATLRPPENAASVANGLIVHPLGTCAGEVTFDRAVRCTDCAVDCAHADVARALLEGVACDDPLALRAFEQLRDLEVPGRYALYPFGAALRNRSGRLVAFELQLGDDRILLGEALYHRRTPLMLDREFGSSRKDACCRACGRERCASRRRALIVYLATIPLFWALARSTPRLGLVRDVPTARYVFTSVSAGAPRPLTVDVALSRSERRWEVTIGSTRSGMFGVACDTLRSRCELCDPTGACLHVELAERLWSATALGPLGPP